MILYITPEHTDKIGQLEQMIEGRGTSCSIQIDHDHNYIEGGDTYEAASVWANVKHILNPPTETENDKRSQDHIRDESHRSAAL